MLIGVLAVRAEPAVVPAAPPAAAAVTVPATGLLGDLRTADPCALVDLVALRAFGDARVDAAYGGFARCDVLVEPAPDNRVDVKIEFFGPPDPGDPAPVGEDVGVGRLVRGTDDGESCERPLVLADGNQVDVTARYG